MGLEMSQPGLDHSALVEEVKETTALVILALGSMMHISEEQASGVDYLSLTCVLRSISVGWVGIERCMFFGRPWLVL